MKRLRGLWPALLALFMFSCSAAVWAAADLGAQDALEQYGSLTATHPLAVYVKSGPDAPALTGEAVKTLRALSGARHALPVAEAAAALSGPGYEMDAVLYAVSESALSSSGVVPVSGRLPHSVWRTEALMGSALAGRLGKAAEAAGMAAPGRFRFALKAENETVKPLDQIDVFISGVAPVTGSAADNAVWLETGLALPTTRCDVYATDLLAVAELKAGIESQGYLAVNPLEEQARVIREGRATARQWMILTILAGLAAVAAAWRSLGGAGFTALPAAAFAAAAGIAAAATLIQSSMMLGLRFLMSDAARYLLNTPRILAIFAVCEAIAVLFTFFLPKYWLPFHPAKGV